MDVNQLLESAAVDANLHNAFDTAEDVQRVKLAGCYTGTHPFWIDVPAEKGGHPGNPNPGRRGILAVHPQDDTTPA